MSRRIIIERSCEVCGLYEASDHWDQEGERCDGAPTRTVLSAPSPEMVERAAEVVRDWMRAEVEAVVGGYPESDDAVIHEVTRFALTAALFGEEE